MLTVSSGLAAGFALPAFAAFDAYMQKPVCTTVSTSKGSMTAAVVDPGNVSSGTLRVSNCQIGVYYDQNGSLSNVNISGATYYGVFVDKGASVNITDSTITDIGDQPSFTGAQHGVDVYYTDGSSGTVSGNTLSDYQKNGFAATETGTNVAVLNNIVDGNGIIPYIAQNGIEFAYGASGSARGNDINGNWYSGATWSSTGLLLFDVNANQVKTSNNKFTGDQHNLALVTAQACPHEYDGFYEQYGLCTYNP